MIRTSHSTLHAMNGLVIATAIAFLMIGAEPATADTPADRSASARSKLSDFAKSWIGKMKKTEAQNKTRPSVRPGAVQTVTSYRGIADGYNVELRPTGQPSAPFIGILRYTEQVYTCREAAGDNCSVASSVPVTEIFRYQAGKWVY